LFEGVIFDCDGVLVDSEKIAVKIDHEMLREAGLEITIDEVVHHFLGKSESHFVEVAEDLLGASLPANWLKENEARYKQAFETELTTVQGIEAVLRNLTLPFCVASNGSHEKMRLTLGKTGLLPMFENRMFSSTQVLRGKPHPDLFLFAAETMGWQASSCLVVEDSKTGVEAALSAGMRVAAFAGGFVKHNEFTHKNLRVIHEMDQLLELLTEPSLWSRS
jgi:HAD superfamily hydrolase (TIGR01509 family)